MKIFNSLKFLPSSFHICLKLSIEKVFAFTLAEVLITLGIIGIVAAITIPTLISNYQKKQYVIQLQKVYTTVNQALVQIASNSSCVGDLACTGLFDTTTTSQSLGDALVPYFKVVKNCETNTNQGCMSNSISQYYDGSNPRINMDATNSVYRFITADGAAFYIYNNKDNCSNNRGVNNSSPSKMCGEFNVDVNGPQKGPNNMGRDVFYFYITNGKGPLLYPVGGRDMNISGTSYYWKDMGACTPANGNSSNFCTGKIIEEGWQMNY